MENTVSCLFVFHANKSLEIKFQQDGAVVSNLSVDVEDLTSSASVGGYINYTSGLFGDFNEVRLGWRGATNTRVNYW